MYVHFLIQNVLSYQECVEPRLARAGRLWTSISQDGQFDLYPLYMYKLRQKHHLNTLHPLRSRRYHGLQVRRQALHLTFGDTNPVRQVAELYEATCRSSYSGSVGGNQEYSTDKPEHRQSPRAGDHEAVAFVLVLGAGSGSEDIRLGARRRQCSLHRARRQAVQGVDRARGDQGSLSGCLH